MENTAAAASDSATASFGQAEDGQRKRPTKARRMMDFPRSRGASLLLQESNNILSVRPSDSVFTSDEIAVLKRADDATTGNGVLWTIRVACLDNAIWRGPATWDVWYGRRGNLPIADVVLGFFPSC